MFASLKSDLSFKPLFMPMRNGIGLVRFALLPRPFGPVVHGDVAPVEVAGFELLPIFLGLGFPDGDDLPQRGHAQDHAVVDPVRLGLVAAHGDGFQFLGEVGQLIGQLAQVIQLFFELFAGAACGTCAGRPAGRPFGGPRRCVWCLDRARAGWRRKYRA